MEEKKMIIVFTALLLSFLTSDTFLNSFPYCSAKQVDIFEFFFFFLVFFEENISNYLEDFTEKFSFQIISRKFGTFFSTTKFSRMSSVYSIFFIMIVEWK